MLDLMQLLDGFVRISYYLIYVAIAIHFLNKKNNTERLRFLLIVGSVFFVIFLSMGVFDFSPESSWSFTLVQMAIIAILALAGIPLMLSKEVVLALFAIYFIALFQTFFLSFLLGIIAYIIVTWGFILSALDIVEKWMGGNANPEAKK